MDGTHDRLQERRRDGREDPRDARARARIARAVVRSVTAIWSLLIGDITRDRGRSDGGTPVGGLESPSVDAGACLDGAKWPAAAAALAALLDEAAEPKLGALDSQAPRIAATWLAGDTPEAGVLLLPPLRVCGVAPERGVAAETDAGDAAAAPVVRPSPHLLLHRAVVFGCVYRVPQLLLRATDGRSGEPLPASAVLSLLDPSAILSPVETGWPVESPLSHLGRWLALHPCTTAASMILLLGGAPSGDCSLELYMRAWWTLAQTALSSSSSI